MIRKKKLFMGLIVGAATLTFLGAGGAVAVFHFGDSAKQVSPVAVKSDSVQLDFSKLPKKFLNQTLIVKYETTKTNNSEDGGSSENSFKKSFNYSESNTTLTLPTLQSNTEYKYTIYESNYKEIYSSSFRTGAPLTATISPALGASSKVIALSIKDYSQYGGQALTIKATPSEYKGKSNIPADATKKAVSVEWKVPVSTSNAAVDYLIKDLTPDTEYVVQLFDKSNVSSTSEGDENKDGTPLLAGDGLILKTDKEFGYEVISTGLGDTVIKFSGLGNLRIPDSDTSLVGSLEANTSVKVKFVNLDDEDSSKNSFEEKLSLVEKFEGGDSFKNTASIVLNNLWPSSTPAPRKILLGKRYSMEIKSESSRIKSLESIGIINFNSGGAATDLFNTFDKFTSTIDKKFNFALINLRNVKQSDWNNMLRFAKSQYEAGGKVLITEDKDKESFDYSVSNTGEISKNVSQSIFYNIVTNIEKLITSALSKNGLNYNISNLKGVIFGVENVQNIMSTNNASDNSQPQFIRANNPILGLYPTSESKDFLTSNGNLISSKLKNAIVDMINNFTIDSSSESGDSKPKDSEATE